METKTQTRKSKTLTVKVAPEDVLDVIARDPNIKRFTNREYEKGNRENSWNMTMLPDENMIQLSPLQRGMVIDQVDKAERNRENEDDDCEAQFSEIQGHRVTCWLPKGHTGAHINIQCGDINAIWENN